MTGRGSGGVAKWPDPERPDGAPDSEESSRQAGGGVMEAVTVMGTVVGLMLSVPLVVLWVAAATLGANIARRK